MTPPKCLPWEWTMVGKRGQKRALSLRYPFKSSKINQNIKKTWKSSKIRKTEKVIKSTKSEKWQKWENHKMQKWQNQENGKVKKWQKQENAKTRKVKKVKNTKMRKWKVEKVKNLKNPKMSDKWHFLTVCVFRAAWLGAFSVPGGTTGPVFKAEIGCWYS